MKVSPQQLNKHLRSTLAQAYLVFGSEPLQITESCALIRSIAKNHYGYEERTKFNASQGFNWHLVSEEAASHSLFSQKKILEITLRSSPGSDGSRAIVDLCNNTNEDIIVLLSCDTLDRSSQNTKWFKSVEGRGVVVQTWPVARERLPSWIINRSRGHGLTLEKGAPEALASLTEGNLIACAQEIEKLSLLYETQSVSADMVRASVYENASFTIYQLADAALSGDKACPSIISSLRKNGAEPIMVLWALRKAISDCMAVAHMTGNGKPIHEAFRQHKIWSSKHPTIHKALERNGAEPFWAKMLHHANRIERCIKGQIPGDPWLELSDLVTVLSA